jgi:hypothetical protein
MLVCGTGVVRLNGQGDQGKEEVLVSSFWIRGRERVKIGEHCV